MLDIQLLRDEAQSVASQLSTRGVVFDFQLFENLEQERKALQVEMQSLQNERNVSSKNIGIAKSKGESIDQLMAQIGDLGARLDSIKEKFNNLSLKLDELLLSIPNIPHTSVPIGKSEEDNVEVRRIGEIPTFAFNPLSHDDLGEKLGLLDFESASIMTGARFSVMRGSLARVHRALISFMLDIHTQTNGYTEHYVPYLVNAESLLGTGQLPKFSADLFKIDGDFPYYLIPTAEVPLTNTVRDTILKETDLPIKLTAHTPCFRSEAGAYGRDTKGMIRQHQFEKVELVWIAHPEKSYDALETLLSHAEMILQRLELPYRVMSLCTKDLGFGASKTYDLEVWLPSQNKYREISSCSNCEAFQARRLKARFQNAQTKRNELVHTLNGSGLAVGRTLLAIMENYQQEDGSILIPHALLPYMGGITRITE